jgi:hypothetical protein
MQFARTGQQLFYIGWFDFTRLVHENIVKEIQGIPENEFLNMSADDLASHLAEKYALDIPMLDEEQGFADQREIEVTLQGDTSGRYDIFSDRTGVQRAPATEVAITIPFSGDGQMFFVQPQSCVLSSYRGVEVKEGHLTITVSGVRPSESMARSHVDGIRSAIRQNLETLRQNAAAFNPQLRAFAESKISERRLKLAADRKFAESFGFTLRQRGDAATVAVPVARKRIIPARPKASAAPYKPEPMLDQKTYEEILSILENMVMVMERSPGAFRSIDEPALRMHFLMQLNGVYESQATAETFNYEGKTDILIRADGRNIFIAECKFWTGPKALAGTIDQLLGYASWRDTKVAVLLFNRNKDFSAVVASADAAAKAHGQFKRELGKRSETSFRYLFRHKDDPNRELTLTLMCFDVPG